MPLPVLTPRSGPAQAPSAAIGAWLLAAVVLAAASCAPPVRGAEAPAPVGSCWPAPPDVDPRLCPPDDPRYDRHWEYASTIPEAVDASKMHPREREIGSIGISLDKAWQLTTGRDEVVIAVLDSGIRWDARDLTNKLFLNAGELPVPAGAGSHDANGDGVFDVRDYAGDPRVADGNGNGLLDPGDLIAAFSDCDDDDGNGYPDDISGFDFFDGAHCGFTAGDNDPADDTDFGHGTGIASTAAAETNNGLDDVGVCPGCRILPVRVGDSFVVDANRFARGVVYSVHAGATVIASALGSYNNTPAAHRAIDFAYGRDVPVIASAADEYSYHHNYPSVADHALYVNSIRFNHQSDYRKASTFWGLNPCTNFGARVWISVPAESCSSGSTARLAGVVGLLQSAAIEAGLAPLSAEEIYQLLRMTADDLDNSAPDWGPLRYPARPGFDQLTGYGRLNAYAAVAAVRAGRIPPEADLDGPGWFSIVSPSRTPKLEITGRLRVRRGGEGVFRLEYATGVEPEEKDFVAVSWGHVRGERRGTLGVLDFSRLPLPAGPPPAGREDRDRYSVTLRLRLTDERGLVSEARRSFFVYDDPAWIDHFPLALGSSGEASPLLADLDGDGRDEIVLPTSDGTVRIIRWDRSGLHVLRAGLDAAPALDPSPSARAAGRPFRPRETVVRAAVAGDLSGDGRMSIVVASREGKVYVFSPRGERLGRFPVSIDRDRSRPTGPDRVVESGILSRPVLADLDGRPGMEIVVTALDGHVYAWHHDGRAVEGFPVAIERTLDGARHRAKIVSTPAIGDIDGDGRPEIVLGSNGMREDLSAAYAIRAEGRLHPGGPFVPGWAPVEISAVRGDLLPTIATGIAMEPALVDVDGDGDREVLLYAVTGSAIVALDHVPGGPPVVVRRLSMEPGGASGFEGTTFLAGTGSPLAADTDGDGTPELYAPLMPFRLLTLRTRPAIPLDAPPALGGWRLSVGDSREASARPASSATPHGPVTVPMLDDFPRRMEDLMIFARPIAADLDGDGLAEVVMGSGGYLLHAFRPGGGEADGFPKFTGGWIFSAPAAGDLDGDGRPELVTVTREGYLFAWSLAPREAAPLRATGPAPAR